MEDREIDALSKPDQPPPRSIPVFRPGFDQEELKAVAEVFRSGWLGPGPQAERFEAAFAAYVGAEYAVAVSSCTAALHLSCLALGLEAGDEVLAPSLSFASSAHAPAYCGAVPVFVDVDAVTCTLDVEDLESKITPRSKGIIAVHYAGHPCAMSEIWDLAERHGLWVIEDAAHACGALYRGSRVGGLERTTATCFSFNALKNLSTGDGGMIVTGSAKLAETARRLRWMGIDKSTFERVESGGPEQADRYRSAYEIRELGFKYVMNDITAAIGFVQLGKLDEMQRVRREAAADYHEALKGLPWLERPVERDDVQSAWHLYVIKTPWQTELRTFLNQQAIATSVHYQPLHQQPLYRSSRRRPLPVTERLARELVTLPFHHRLSRNDCDRVKQALQAFSRVLQGAEARES